MRRRRWLVAGALVLAGCGLPEPATRQGGDVASLWRIFLAAGIGVAVVVYGLIAYTIIRYRHRPSSGDDSIPGQRAYNLRMEILYTATPVVIVALLFGISVATERRLTATTANPALTVDVTSFQWGWQFDYPELNISVRGTGEGQLPVLVLPVGETTRLILRTNDVIHSFWVPQFLEKRDVIPGVDNQIDVTPTKVGSYGGRCAEYCGLDHWRMSFTVDVRTRADFERWVSSQR